MPGKKTKTFYKAVKILGVSIPKNPPQQGKTVKFENLGELMLKKRNSNFRGKRRSFARILFPGPFSSACMQKRKS